jgi:anthranilate synthase component 2
VKKILVFDNYDSFTYNLVHLIEHILNEKVDVFRNDEIAIEDIANYEKILLSPGPGIPSEAGILLPLIKRYAPTHSILGVCLGHQAIAEAFGGKLENLSKVYHGLATPVTLVDGLKESNYQNDWLSGLEQTQVVGRYHSWVVKEEFFPEELEITSREENNMIMSLRHRQFDLQGVQFHPESVLTPTGELMMRNWLKTPGL